jgi:hypothetical protein
MWDMHAVNRRSIQYKQEEDDTAVAYGGTITDKKELTPRS